MKNLTLAIGAACMVGLLAASAPAQSGAARAGSPLLSSADQNPAAGYAYADAPTTPSATGDIQAPPPPPDKAYGDQGAKTPEEFLAGIRALIESKAVTE